MSPHRSPTSHTAEDTTIREGAGACCPENFCKISHENTYLCAFLEALLKLCLQDPPAPTPRYILEPTFVNTVIVFFINVTTSS